MAVLKPAGGPHLRRGTPIVRCRQRRKRGWRVANICAGYTPLVVNRWQRNNRGCATSRGGWPTLAVLTDKPGDRRDVHQFSFGSLSGVKNPGYVPSVPTIPHNPSALYAACELRHPLAQILGRVPA